MRKGVRFAMILALLAGMLAPSGSAFAAVSRVGSWTTGLAHTPGAGTSRVVLFAVGYKDSTDPGITGVTFGGKPLTRVAGQAAGTAEFDRVEFWYLGEIGIATATSDSFTVAWGGAVPATAMYGAATYSGVDQAAPLADFDSAFTNLATPNPLTVRVNSKANSYVVASYVCGSDGSYTWNNSFVEGFDQTNGSTLSMSSGDVARTSPGSVQISATHSGPDRQAVVALVLNELGANQPPVLAAIGAQSVAEGDTLSLGISATDPDGTTPTLTTGALPANASFTDNGNGTGTFVFTPSFTQAGSYDVTFYALDGSAVVFELVSITVTDVNQAPVLAAIGAQSVGEGDTLNFGVSASDPDGTTPALTTSTLPGNAIFTDNGDGTGTFDFTPDFTQAGSYDVTFYATDGTDTDSEGVTITVSENSPVTISGNAGMAGVTLSYDTDSTETATTDSSGNYSFSVPYNWTGIVTPSMVGYGFMPASRDYANITADQPGQDYVPGATVGVGDDNTITPDHFALTQNYPNPFNPATAIGFSLEKASYVTIDVFNALGHRVAVLVQSQLAAGVHVTHWNGTDVTGRPVASGVYFYRIQAGDFAQTRKMLLLR